MNKRVSRLLAIIMIGSMLTGCGGGKPKLLAAGATMDGVVKNGDTYDVGDAEYGETGESESKFTSPVGYDMELVIEGLKQTVSGVTFEDSYTDMIENAEMSGYFDFARTHSLLGYGENKLEDIIMIDVKQYARFDKASYLSISYSKKNDKDTKLEKEAKEILEDLFGKTIVKDIYSGETEYSHTYESESGEYDLHLSRTEEEAEKGKFINVTVDYAPVFIRQNSIDDFVAYDKITPLYTELPIFKDTQLKDLANKIGDVWGDYRYGVLVRNTNTESVQNGSKLRSTILQNAVIFNNDTQTAVEIRINTTEKNDFNEFSMFGSTPYRETAEKAVESAAQMISAVYGTELSLTEAELMNGLENKDWEVEALGIKFKQTIDIEFEVTEDGYFARFSVSSKL